MLPRIAPGLPWRSLAVVGATAVLIAALAWMLMTQFLHFANRLPAYQDNVVQRIAAFRQEGKLSLLGKVQDFVEQVSAAATKPIEPTDRESDAPQAVKVVGDSPIGSLAPIASNAGQMAEVLASTGLAMVLVVLMLLHREDIRNRMIRLFGEGRMTLTTKALDDAGKRISRYLFAQFTVNSAFGLIIGCGLWLLGVPYALLWGCCAAVFRYIPFVGSWVALAFPLTLSLLTAESWVQPASVVFLFIVFEVCVNLLVEPWLYGQSIGVSQAGLLVAIAFWAWLWGAPGLVLAPPLTVCLVILGKYVPALKFFDIILGDAPALTPETKFYQRLLVRDQVESAEVIREQLKNQSAEQVVDRILIPALVGARLDVEASRLCDSEVEFMMQAISDVAEEHDFGRLQGGEETLTVGATDQDGSSNGKFDVLACPAREGIDESALALFCKLVDPKVCHVATVSAQELVSDIVARVVDNRPSIVCIVALPAGGLAQSRLLCKRLRSRFADLKIVVARWGLSTGVENERQQLRAAGTEYLATTVHDTMAQLVQLGHLTPPHTEQDSETTTEPEVLVREAHLLASG